MSLKRKVCLRFAVDLKLSVCIARFSRNMNIILEINDMISKISPIRKACPRFSLASEGVR